MTRTALRLAQLDAISRERELTDEEARTVVLLTKRERRNNRRRSLYWLCPEYRQRRIETNGRTHAATEA